MRGAGWKQLPRDLRRRRKCSLLTVCESKEGMGQSPIKKKHTFLGYAACAMAGTLWGTGFYFGRLALNEMSVEAMVLYRFLFACLGMLPVVVTHRVRLTRSETRTLLLAAMFGIPIQFLLQFHGLALTTVSHAALMVGAMPVLLAAAAALFAGERLDWIGWLALCGSTVGAAMVSLGGSRVTTGRETPSLQGDLLVIISLMTALAWILLSKKLMRDAQPAGGDGLHHLLRNRDAGSGDLLSANFWADETHNHRICAGCACERDSMDGAGDQRRDVHGDDYALVELGDQSSPGVASRRFFEY